MGKLLAQKVTAKMPREQLEEHIANTLKKMKMCTLVTSKDDIPRGTPLEYFPDGLMLYIGPDPGKKTINLRANPNVSVSIYNNFDPDWDRDWPTLWGIQITGKGELFPEGHPEHARALKAIDSTKLLKALGRDELPKGREMLKVTPSKIELLEFGLIPKGFAHRQVWRAEA